MSAVLKKNLNLICLVLWKIEGFLTSHFSGITAGEFLTHIDNGITTKQVKYTSEKRKCLSLATKLC